MSYSQSGHTKSGHGIYTAPTFWAVQSPHTGSESFGFSKSGSFHIGPGITGHFTVGDVRLKLARAVFPDLASLAAGTAYASDQHSWASSSLTRLFSGILC